jgi:hypothetical protein
VKERKKQQRKEEGWERNEGRGVDERGRKPIPEIDLVLDDDLDPNLDVDGDVDVDSIVDLAP